MQSSNQPKTDPPPSQERAPGTSPTSTSTAAPETGGGHKPGAAVGEKLRGAVHVVHGAGESLRGSVLGAFGTAFGKDGTEAVGIAGKGKEEYHKGLETLRPGHYGRVEERTQKAPGVGAEGTEEGRGTEAAAQQPEAAKKEAEVRPAAPQPGARPPAPPPRVPATGAGVQGPPPYEQAKAPETGAATAGVQDNKSAPGNVASSQAQGQERYQEPGRKEGQIVSDVGGPAAGVQSPLESGPTETGGSTKATASAQSQQPSPDPRKY